MNSTIKRLSFLLLLCILLALRPAQAQITDTWTGGAMNTAWGNNNNWSAGTPPGTLDEAWFDTTSTVSLPGTPTTVFAIVVDNAPVTLDATASTFTTTHLGIGGLGDGANLTISIVAGGQFVVTGDENFVGDTDFFGGASTGTFNVEGNGTLALTDTDLSFSVGAGVSGVMNQSGGTVSVAGTITVGSDGDVFTLTPTAGSGVYTISSTSTLTINGEMDLGASSDSTAPSSTGVLNINGGLVNGTGIISLGVSEASTTVAGDTGEIVQTDGTLAVNTLNVGESSGGFGSYSLSNTGTYSLQTFNVGDQAGASGTVTQTGGSGTITGALNVGENGRGSYSISNGSIMINAGAGLTVGDQTGAVGTFTQSGGTVTTTGTGSVTVGNNGTGTYILSGGTLTTGMNGALNIGAGTGTGTFTLSGGTLNLNGGATLGGSGGVGVFNENSDTITYGSSLVVSGGSTFNQNADNTPSSGNPIFLESGAIYNLNAGTLNVGGDMEFLGGSGLYSPGGASFNFAGGTVATSSNWTDELDGSVTGSSTINTAGGSATLSGDLTGSGILTFTGGGTGTIDPLGTGNSSAGAWSLYVTDASTVNALATTFPASGGIAIDGGSTVNMATSGGSTLGGVLSGGGAFDVNFGATTDTLTLAGQANFSGVTTLNGGGTLQALQGTYGAITDGGVGGNNVVIGTTSGSGAVTFTGNSTYTGSTTVDSGYSLFAKNFTGNVTNNGSFGLTGGTVGTMNIGGSLVSTGTLLIRTSGTAADLYNVTGSANISGDIALVNPPATSATNTIVISSGLTLGPITETVGNRFVTVGITQSGNDLILGTTVNPTNAIPGLNLTPNEASIAGPLNSLLGNSSHLTPGQFINFSTLLNDVGRAGTSNSQLATNLDQIGPESLQYGSTIAILNATSMVQHVDNYTLQLNHGAEGFNTTAINVVAPGFDSDMGREMQSMFAYDPSTGFHGSAPNGVNYYPGSDGGTISDSGPPSSESSGATAGSKTTVSDSPPPLFHADQNSMVLRKPWSHFSAFVGGDVTIADLNQDSGATYAPPTKASYTAVGAVGGISYRMTNNLAAGVLMDYMHTDAETDKYGSKMGVNTYSPGVFATFGDKGFFLNGIFSFGINNYNNSRTVPVVGSVANSNPNGTQYVGDLDAGYEFHPAREWTLTPQAGVTYTHLDVDSFTETGASPDDLNVAAQHVDSLRSRLGGTLVYTVHPGQLTLQPSITAMWQHEFLDENPAITSNFSDFASQNFTIHSVGLGSDSALLSIGITATFDNSMGVFLNATADVNNQYNAENIVGGFKSTF